MATKRAAQPRKSVWLTPAPTARRRRGGDDEVGAGNLSRDKIVEVAVRLLDAEGVAGFSMRRLAGELNVTPMSVYWYVANKDDLLELALDAVAGEAELPDLNAGREWSDELRALAAAWRRVMVAHPWAIRCYGEYLNIGPQSMRFSQYAQTVVARSPLPEDERPAALAAVFQYTYGFASMESRLNEYGREAGGTADDFLAEIAGTVAEVPGMDAPDGLVGRRAGLSVQQVRDQDFGRALDWLIAGMRMNVA